jgi:two-component system nitrate/nitrite response regulator NarL
MRIMVVSPVRLFRDCLAAVLGSMQPVPEVVAEASVAALYHRLPGEHPDVVLVDVTQDIGMEEVALVAAKWLNLPLLALGMLERREEVVRHGRAGFVGYVARDATIQDLQSAISDAVAGRMQCPAEISGGLIRALFTREHPSTPGYVAPSLTRREAEVLQMIGRGLSNKEIARDLDLSVATIKCHVHNVLAKLGVGHRSHAMRKVRAEPWIGTRF